MQSGSVGRVSYRSCLTVHRSAEGLFLSVLLPFRPGHPPLFIPWNAVRNATSRRILWVERVAFEVGSPGLASVQLSPKIFEGRKVAHP